MRQIPPFNLGTQPAKMPSMPFAKLPLILNIGKISRFTTLKRTMKQLSSKTMYLASNLSVSVYLIFPISSDLRYHLVQLLEDEPFKAFRPVVDKLILDKDQDKQRAAAEFLAGVLGGAWDLCSYNANHSNSCVKALSTGQLISRMHYGNGLLRIYPLFFSRTLNLTLCRSGLHSLR